ncbi:hypothetical protein [Streptomyces sp. NPDC003720]|uniref:hypothetical protein n=1 Tax=Streptomyces sp. NPDC003720 TaxID=3364684 RepID=UPI0036B4442A
MPTRKVPPTKQPLKLEGFHTVGEAAVRMNFKTQAEHDAGSTKGERWLRDGCNRPEDGSEGQPFPHHRMNGCLMFSDTDLAEIAAMHRNARTQGARRRMRRLQPAA